ncbi:hypothetical protein DICPUDRAFT_36006 [Dictyostelium purpureum]|uniref:Peptidase S28 family protein n=1 Tax=Dictyostelium purpureum TaxID=5786 RepID=F0ZQ90_DICPU|nr:uncharacterized protein DICPUDRAFT_36006 [Dictyostelium purpureum]EGC33895.1 hypothetical protein DICPUDRAFT_36006 [Dictyostelium purpureum]|eukprot:XP_003289578.1 hypothetical protein DICPUDRAFT_36006 [Dictyostelium purpureum]
MNKSIFILVLVLLGLINSIDAKRGFNAHRDLRRPLRTQKIDSGLDLSAINYQWFTQNVDHFNIVNTDTFQQRYLINDQYYDGTGPVFIMINGEGPMGLDTVTGLQFVVWAKQLNALIVSLEHRYYGASFVTSDLSLDNLQFLNSQQALADNAVFREFIAQKYNIPSTTKWVSFGGSYSGALTSWFRIKYPHLVDITIASSGPVNPEVNFYQYLQVVQNSLQQTNGGAECVQNIAIATDKVQSLLQQDNYGGVETLFDLCSQLENANDVANFMNSLAGNFMGVVQYNNEEPGQVNTQNLCDIMTNNTQDPLTNYIQLWNQFAGGECVDVSYSSLVAESQNITNDATAIGGRMWMYQTCTEFGYYQSSDGASSTQPFGDLFGFAFQLQQCADIFGVPNMAPNTNWTLTEYGGLSPAPSSITTTLYVNGLIDPWHALGITPVSVPSIKNSLLITGTAHCADMMIPTSVSPSTLAPAQQTIFNFIKNNL